MGIALTPNREVALANWRTRQVSVLSQTGELQNKFTHDCLVEPIDIAINSRGEIIVADIGACKIYIFDTSGKLLTTFGNKGEKEGQFRNISAVAIGKCDEILVSHSSDHRIQIFAKDGKFSRQVPSQSKGEYGGIVVDLCKFSTRVGS